MKATRLRTGWLQLLRRLGITSFVSSAGGRSNFVCHVGDFLGELPFYNLDFFKTELVVSRAWCVDLNQPVIFDIGAHVGFVASQFAQALRPQNPVIFSFEPVLATFEKLELTIERLGLQEFIVPLPCGLSSECGLLRMHYDKWDSMLAQVVVSGNDRPSQKIAYSAALTIDDIAASTNLVPALLKVDVEGYEPHVFRGAIKLLTGKSPPGILFELNPGRLHELGLGPNDLSESLPGYTYYYVNSWRDRSNERLGQLIENLSEISLDCDVFAVPNTDEAKNRWNRVLSILREQSQQDPSSARSDR